MQSLETSSSRSSRLQPCCVEYARFSFNVVANNVFPERLFGGLGICGRLFPAPKSGEIRTRPPGRVPSGSVNDITSLRDAKFIGSSLNKMWILPLVGYIGLALGFGFLTLAIGRFLPTSESWFADAYRLHSVRTILPLGTRRRAYGVC